MQGQQQLSYKETEIILLNKILKNEDSFDNINFITILSLIFKRTIKNDNLIQMFETEFLRKNSYKINSLQDLYKELQNEDNIKYNNIVNIVKKIIDYLEKDKTLSNNDNKDFQQEKDIINIIEQYIKENFSKENINQNNQLHIQTQRNIKYGLTPTQGVAMLNNNPYSFFVNKVLKLSPIEQWTNNIDSRHYGEIIHRIMELFSYKTKNILKQDNTTLKGQLEYIFNQTMMEVLQQNKIKINFFLREKINNIREIAIDMETEAINNGRIIEVEKKYKTIIDNIEISARADRIEIDNKKKEIYIYDFKTGQLPKNADEINGKKTQLLIIAMLILKQKEYKDFSIKRMRYIDISGKKNQKNEDIDLAEISFIEPKIINMINQYFDENQQPIIENMKYIQPSNNMIYDNDIMIMKFARKSFIFN